jgi:predicted 3-demethylubiquinone-9 3-methyltransferase (glyoxalase superfamily)
MLRIADMALTKHPITPCLWFDSQALEAANFYTSIFKNSKIETISRYTSEGKDIHGHEEGTVLTVVFQLDGQTFTALNGGPIFKFNEAVSFQVFCDTQEEIDYYWDRLTEGGEESYCGWLKDKYGLSWQVVPSILPKLITDPERAERVTRAFMQMRKFDIATLEKA